MRRDTGEGYREMLERMAQESGIATPTAEDLIRLDRKRKSKTLSNEEWVSATDPDARIARMKDGTTHLAYKPEHAIDLDTGAVIAAEVHAADEGDTTTLTGTLDAAQRNLTRVGAPPSSDDPAACVADKGYHSRAVLTDLDGGPWKTRIAEPQRRGISRWHGDTDARRAVYANRVRLRSEVGQQAMRNRAELVERSFAHILDRGEMRRTWLRGRENVHKRYLIHVAGHNLGLLMRLLIGAGTPKEAVARGWCLLVLLPTTDGAADAAILMLLVENSAGPALILFRMSLDHHPDGTTTSSTGCYATAAEFERVRDGDLRQMLWYVCKASYKQYQLWKGENSLRQWDRPINGVNSVRLYAELHNATLDQLTIASGEGRAFLKALRQDARGWQQNARAKGHI